MTAPSNSQTDRDQQWTERQREVFALLVRGMTNGQIAETLGISLAGAKWHLAEIMSILGVGTREEAADYWRQSTGLMPRLRRFTRALVPAGGLVAWAAGGGSAVALGGVGAMAIVLAVASGGASGGGDPAASAATVDTSTTAAALAAASPSPPADQGAAVDPDRLREIRDELLATPEYQAAAAAQRACLVARGYQFQSDTVVVMLDGTVDDLMVARGRAVEGAWLDWRINNEQCEDQSGVTALLIGAGLPVGPQAVARGFPDNALDAAAMDCVASAGLPVPTPKELRGGLKIYDKYSVPTEIRERWTLTRTACVIQLRSAIPR